MSTMRPALGNAKNAATCGYRILGSIWGVRLSFGVACAGFIFALGLYLGTPGAKGHANEHHKNHTKNAHVCLHRDVTKTNGAIK